MNNETFPSKYAATLPNRTPDFRWRRAEYMAKQGIVGIFSNDQTTNKAARYIRSLRGDWPTHDFYDFTNELSQVGQALELHQSPSCLVRFEVQCRILARQPDHDIAFETGIAEDVIALYHELFFDFPLVHPLVVPLHFHGRTDPETIALLGCYCNGPGVVDGWLDYLKHADKCHDLETEIGRRRESFAVGVLSKQVLQVPMTEGQAARFIAGVARLDPAVVVPLDSDQIFWRVAWQSLQQLDWNVNGRIHPRWTCKQTQHDPIRAVLAKEMDRESWSDAKSVG